MCDQREMWEDNPEVAEFVNKRMRKANGKAWEYEDRRQELVFMGQGLNIEYIQDTHDQCLLSDEEMLLGPERWRESMGNSNRIGITWEMKTMRRESRKIRKFCGGRYNGWSL